MWLSLSDAAIRLHYRHIFQETELARGRNVRVKDVLRITCLILKSKFLVPTSGHCSEILGRMCPKLFRISKLKMYRKENVVLITVIY